MSVSIEPLSVLVENAHEALRAATLDPSPTSVESLTIALLSLHGRVARALVSLPDVVGDDVPWASIGDRDLWVSAVTGALTVQRGRIAALAEGRDPSALVESCRLSLQTIATIARDVERMFPMPQPRERPHAASVQRPRFRAGPLETTGPLPPVDASRPGAVPAA